jgi:hypothetical protein
MLDPWGDRGGLNIKELIRFGLIGQTSSRFSNPSFRGAEVKKLIRTSADIKLSMRGRERKLLYSFSNLFEN